MPGERKNLSAGDGPRADRITCSTRRFVIPGEAGRATVPDTRNLAADFVPQQSNTADRLASATGAVGSELVRRSPHRTTSLTITGGRANLPHGSPGDHRFSSERARIS